MAYSFLHGDRDQPFLLPVGAPYPLTVARIAT
jgi:hypothetical protein